MKPPPSEDKDMYLDHFAAVRLLPDRVRGRCLWLGAHGFAFTAALAGFVGFIFFCLLAAGLLFHLGIHLRANSEEVSFAEGAVPVAWRASAVCAAALAISLASIWGILTAAARGIPRTFRFPEGGRAAPSRRESRREAAARVRRADRRYLALVTLAALVMGSILVALEWPSFEPWAGGISLLARFGRTIIVLLAGIGAVVTLLVLALLFWFVLEIAGSIRSGCASRFLPVRARPPKEPQPAEEEPPSPPPAQPSPPPPSPSLLVYLFADRVLSADSALSLGAPVPCASTEVKMNDLVEAAFAAAFWGLRERGAIGLAPSRRRRLLVFFRRRIEVTRLRVELPLGLEGAVMGVPNVDPEAYVDEDTSGRPGPLGDVRGVIRTWFGSLHEDPEWKVVSALLDEAKDLGLVVEGAGDRESELRLRCAAIAAEKPALESFLPGWRRFQEQEPVLHALLLRECRKAIRGAREYPNGGLLEIAVGLGIRARARTDRPWPKPGDRE